MMKKSKTDLGWYICPACGKAEHHLIEMDLNGNLHCTTSTIQKILDKVINKDQGKK